MGLIRVKTCEDFQAALALALKECGLWLFDLVGIQRKLVLFFLFLLFQAF